MTELVQSVLTPSGGHQMEPQASATQEIDLTGGNPQAHQWKTPHVPQVPLTSTTQNTGTVQSTLIAVNTVTGQINPVSMEYQTDSLKQGRNSSTPTTPLSRLVDSFPSLKNPCHFKTKPKTLNSSNSPL